MSLSDATSNYSNLSLTNESYVQVPSEHSQNAQQDESEPSAGASVASDGLLKLALPADESSGKEEDRYAVVPMPDSYVEAQSVALEVFGSYIDTDVKANRLTLRTSVRNRKGEWCWADIRPQDWETTIKSSSDEVGVFYLRPLSVPLAIFTVGRVGLVYGAHGNRGIEWNTGDRPTGEISDPNMTIDRPRSYHEAMETVGRVNFPYCITAGDITAFRQTIRTKHLKFYWFTSVSVPSQLPSPSGFIEFPEIAYTDEDGWRTIVPEPGKLLGFTIEDSSPA